MPYIGLGRPFRVQTMKSSSESTHNLLAAMLIGMSIAISTVAQPPPSSERRKACAGIEGLERKRCESLNSPSGGGLELQDFGSNSILLDESDSARSLLTDDLKYLKTAAANLTRALESTDLDFRAIAAETKEVRKRAIRIRSSLALPNSGPKEAIRRLELPADRPQLRLLIQALSVLIKDAVRDELPTGRVLHVIGSLKARSDLDAIVELSERIRTQCELLGESDRQ